MGKKFMIAMQNLLFFLLLLPISLSGQRPTPVDERGENGELVIEIRELPSGSDFSSDKIPKEDEGDYFVGQDGTIYKLFNHVESFIAHYNGYHPRPKASADHHIVYIKSLEDAGKFDLDFPVKEGWDSYLIKYNVANSDVERIDRN